METPSPTGERPSFKGAGALIIALAVLVGMAVVFRLFFLVIVGIGLVVAAILYLWHRFRPIREEDVNNKHPLGLG